MAIRNDQYLFREGPGRGEISPQDPLETRLYDVNGNIYDKDNPFEVRVRKLEEILGLAEENPEQYTLAARLKRIEDMLESGSAKVTLTGHDIVLCENATAPMYAPLVEVGACSQVVLRIVGEFVGEMRVYASPKDTTPGSADLIQTITGPGTYLFDVAQYRKWRFRVYAVLSGSVSAYATLVPASFGSYVLDDNGVPVQRVFDASPHAYDQNKDAIKTLELNAYDHIGDTFRVSSAHDGNLYAKLGSAYEVETLLDAVTVQPGQSLPSVTARINNARLVYVAISYDQQPWRLIARRRPWSSEGAFGTGLYPQLLDVTKTYTVGLPKVVLLTLPLPVDDQPESWSEAQAVAQVADTELIFADRRSSGDPGKVTIKVLRVYR